MIPTDHYCSSDNNSDNDKEDDSSAATATATTALPSQFRINYKEQLRQFQQHDASDNDADANNSDYHSDVEEEQNECDCVVLSNQCKVLQYESFLRRIALANNNGDNCSNHNSSHFDDCKHIDYHYIDYGYCALYSYDHRYDVLSRQLQRIYNSNNSIDPSRHDHYPLIIRQNKSITGKGGFCWDAAFILAEYIVHTRVTPSLPNTTVATAVAVNEHDSTYSNSRTHNVPSSSSAPLLSNQYNDGMINDYTNTIITQQYEQSQPQQSNIVPPSVRTTTKTIEMIELGCGTGVCGMYVAKSLQQLSLLPSSSSFPSRLRDEDNNTSEQSARQENPHKFEHVSVPVNTTATVIRNSGNILCNTNICKNNYNITLTDMDGPIQKLIQNNLYRNFDMNSTSTSINKNDVDTTEKFDIIPTDVDEVALCEYIMKYYSCFEANDNLNNNNNDDVVKMDLTKSDPTKNGKNFCTNDQMVLDWDEYSTNYNIDSTSKNHRHYDIVFGSDIVATIYDPIHLAQTIFYLCHPRSIVYISYKERYTPTHVKFQNMITSFFHNVTIFHTSTGNIIYSSSSLTGQSSNIDANNNKNTNDNNIQWTSRNLNPNVYIIIASCKKHPNDIPSGLLQ